MNESKEFIYFNIDGIMKTVKIPEHGVIQLKSQDGKIVWADVTKNIKF